MKAFWTILDPKTGRKELWEALLVEVVGETNRFVTADARLVAVLYPAEEGTW